MNLTRKIPYLLLIIALIASITIPILSFQSPTTETSWNPERAFRTALNSLNFENIINHVKTISRFGSRFTGYKGYKDTATYIYNYLANDLKLITWYWTYKALVPYDYNSTLTILSPVRKTYRVYALLPNMIQTCRGEFTGRLIYVGDGTVKEFEGKNVTGSIVLMRYNTKSNWMYALNLGAKGVIFICPRQTVRGEGDYKVLEVPIRFPRVLLSYEDSKELVQVMKEAKERGEEVIVKLKVNMFWKEVTLKNVFALIPGTEGLENESDIIMVVTYFDAYGIAPALTPAADEASSPATLLEFARILKEKRPTRNVLLAFFSGQGIGMAGTRYFAEELFFHHWDEPMYFNTSRGLIGIMGDQISCVFTVDFSTDSPALALVTIGTFYGGFDWTRAGRIEDMESYLKSKIGGEYEFITRTFRIAGRGYKVYFALRWEREALPSQVNHIGEVFNHVNIFALTFFTAHAARVFWETPADTIEVVNFKNLKPQAEFSIAIIYTILSDPRESTKELLRGIMHGHSRSAPLGFALLRGKVRYYNFSRAWYDNNWGEMLDDGDIILVYLKLYRARVHKHCFVILANETGDFEVPGVKPSGWALGAFEYQIFAFIMNNKTGEIKWAPDYGYYGRKLWPYENVFTLRSSEETSGQTPVNIILFKCGAIVIHDVIDPTTLSTPLLAMLTPYTFTIYDSRSNAEALQYGYFISTPPSPVLTQQIIALGIGDPAVGYDAIIFVPPNTPVDIVFRSLGEDTPLAIISNIEVREGEYYDISITALKFAEEMLKLVDDKLTIMRNEPTLSGSISKAVEYYEKALNCYNEAVKALNKGKFSEAYALIYRSWHLARKSYTITREVYINIVFTDVMLILLIIPTALILERFLFEKMGLQRIIYTLFILILLGVAAYILHPGLRIAWNTLMASLSMFSCILVLPVLGFIISGVITLAKELRRRLIGVHFIDVSRLSIFSAALSMGVSNLKKRPLRAILTFTSVICLILSLVLFTSWTFGDFYTYREILGTSKYTGILIETGTEGLSISPSLLEYLIGYFGNKGIICPRAWLQPPTPGIWIMNEKGDIAYAKAIVGVTEDEPLLKDFVAGLSWYGPSFIAAISSDIAEELGISEGDAIYVAGMRLTVVRVIRVELLSEYLRDISGNLITPRDPDAPPGSPIRTKDKIILIPFSLAIRVGGFVTSVAVVTDEATAKKAAMDFSEHLYYLAVYFSDKNRSYLARWIRGYELRGLSQVGIPIAIVILALLNVMVSAVYERTREIQIYSILGLSPMHVAAMIFTEGFVYAIVGATAGYLISLVTGYVVSNVLHVAHMVDFSSPYPALSVLFSMLAVIIAGVYPAVKASGYVTPSLERKWRIPTKPIGDVWYVPLPMSVSSKKIAYSMLAYIMEYLTSAILEEKFRVDEKPHIIKQDISGRKAIGISLKVRLPPYDAAILEDTKILAIETEDGKIAFGVHSRLLSGKRYLWIASHRNFIDEIRKQLLVWKSLREKDVEKYLKMSEELFKEVEENE